MKVYVVIGFCIFSYYALRVILYGYNYRYMFINYTNPFSNVVLEDDSIVINLHI